MSFLLLKKLFTLLFMSTSFFDPLQYKGNNGTLLRQCLQSIFRNNAEKEPPSTLIEIWKLYFIKSLV